MLSVLLAGLAGFLTIFAPCVLPVLPLILGGTTSRIKFATYYMALGMTLSFSFLGVIFAAFGSVLGIDPEMIRFVSGFLLIFLGCSMIFPKLSAIIENLTSSISNKANNTSSKLSGDSKFSNIAIGSLLGAIWAPCSGPSLGVAITLASSSGNFLLSFLHFFSFGFGASIGLILISAVLSSSLKSIFPNFVKQSHKVKVLFGYIVLICGFMIILRLDKKIETTALDFLPESIVNLSSSF